MRITRQTVYTLISFLLFVGMIGYNATAGQSMIGLREIFPFPLMPPGWTFGISRGLIYLSLIGFLIALRRLPRETKTKEIHHLFRVSCFFNCSWLYLSSQGHHGLGVFFLLSLTIVVYSLLAVIQTIFLPFPRKYLLHIPIGLYLGRACVATWVLGGSQLLHLRGGIAFSGHPYRIIAALIGISLIGGRIRHRFRYPSTMLLLGVGLTGIISLHRSATPRIAGTALGSAMLLVAVVLWTLLPDIKKTRTFVTFLILLGLFLALAVVSKEKLFEGFKLLWGVA